MSGIASKDRNSAIRRAESIDWDEVRRHLDTAAEAVEKGFAPEGAEKKRILEKRAAMLALPAEMKPPGTQIEVIEFLLSHERYGVESRYVREVFPLQEYTPVPCTPSFVTGIINLRGEILSIIDLKRFFGLAETGLSDLNRVIVLSSPEMEFGILADAIVGVRGIVPEELQSPPLTFAGFGRDYLTGICAEGTAILDAGKILADPGIVVNEFV